MIEDVANTIMKFLRIVHKKLSISNQELDLSGHTPTYFETTRTSTVTVDKRNALVHKLPFQAQTASSHRATSDIDLTNVKAMSIVSGSVFSLDELRADACNSFKNCFGGGVRYLLGPALVSRVDIPRGIEYLS